MPKDIHATQPEDCWKDFNYGMEEGCLTYSLPKSEIHFVTALRFFTSFKTVYSTVVLYTMVDNEAAKTWKFYRF